MQMKKRVKKYKYTTSSFLKIEILLIVAFLLVAIIILLVNINQSFTGRAVFTPTIPTDCSDTQIRAVWDSIYQESSSGITLFTNTSQAGKCNAYLAYKINGETLRLLQGSDVSLQILGVTINMTAILASEGNFTQEYLSIIKNITSPLNNTYLDGSSSIIIPEEYSKTRNIDISQADSEFKSIFKTTPSTWMTNSTTVTSYYFIDNETLVSGSRGSIGRVIANYTTNLFAYSKLESSQSCISNWTAKNTSCQSDDRLITWFNDTFSCGNSPPANLTFHCDSKGNGIIGNFSRLNSSFSLSIYINSTQMNLSQNYSSKVQKIQFKSGSDSIIEFDWNFSQPFDFDNVYIEKQSSSASRGYILIRGINASKIVLVDRIANSTRVCIRNEEISSISDMTENCTASNEIILDCPGSSSSISCAVPTTYFTITGLAHSAVKEVTQGAGCIPNWNCTSWTTCTANIQNRTCTDKNNCNNPSTRPVLNQSCDTIPLCSSSWQCGNWTKCKNGNQTRVCIDKNSCPGAGSKTEKQSCKEETKFSARIILIIVLSTLVLIVAIILVYFLLRKKDENLRGIYISPQSAPPRF